MIIPSPVLTALVSVLTFNNQKMKILRNLWLVLMLSFIFSSCEKYLDIKKSNTQSFIETAEDCQLILDNYAIMNTGYPSDGEASADDYYLLEVTYNSVTSLGQNPERQENRDLYGWMATAQRNLSTPQWVNPYKVVYHANLVLETLEELKGGTDQAVLNGLRGSALFYRAFAFWTVAQNYAPPYNAATAGADLGIPLRITSDINDQYGRGTVQQTYDRIIQDLQEAGNLLSPSSVNLARPNKAAAYAMLARTYLSMENYPQALVNANAALQVNNQLLDYSTLNPVSTTPFIRFNKEVIFHSVMAAQPLLNPGFASSNTAKIVPELINSYAVNDLRKTVLFESNTGAVHGGTFRFVGNYDQTTSSAFFNGLATDELYLIKAECLARANDVQAAMDALNALLVTRWVPGTYVNKTAATADQALGIILEERRKELLMRGLRWTELRRLNRDTRFKRDLERKLVRSDKTEYVIGTLPANDPRYTLLIPREVIANAGIAQNPR